MSKYFHLDAPSAEENTRRDSIIRDLLDGAREKAAAVRSDYVKTRAAEGRTIAATGGDAGLAYLGPGHEIGFPDGSSVSVAELVANPEKYHGRHCLEPMEPDYAGADGQIAKLYLLDQRSGPMIRSLAHGGINYALGWGAPVPSAQDDFDALPPVEAKPEAEETPAAFEQLNREYALVKELPGVVLNTPPDDKLSLIPTPHFKLIVGRNPKTVERWLHSPLHREYRKLVMRPDYPPRAPVPNSTRRDDFNLWEGFALKPSIEGSCDLFLDHTLNITCDGDPERYRWVMMWYADLFQNPGKPVGTALVQRGGQGAGKDTPGEILGAILGPQHYTVVSSPEEITGSFTAHLEGVILAHAEEAFFAGDKRVVGKLKSLITSPRLRINQKFTPAYEVDSLLRLFLTSNEDWIVPAGLGERRFAVLDVCNARAKDRPYFAALRRQMFDEGGCARLLHHLLYEVEVDRDLIAQPPATKALLSQQERSLTGVQRWAMNCAQIGHLPGGGSTPDTEAVFAAALRWTRGHELDRATQSSIGELLAKYGVEKQRVRIGNGKRQHQYVFPPLAEFRAALGKELSVQPEWDDVNEWEPEVGLEALP